MRLRNRKDVIPNERRVERGRRRELRDVCVEPRDERAEGADDASRAATDAAGEALKQAEYAKAVGKEVGEYIKPESLEFEGGRYTNIPRYIESRRDARIFTVKIPKWAHSHDTACERADDAAGLSCEPSTNASQGRDDFAKYAAFMSKTCNGYVEDDGTPVVTAFEGDSGFRADGSNGDVWQMAPVLFWRWSETETHASLSVSDTWHAGFDPQPGARLPDGMLRPFMLYAKYALGKGPDGRMASVSGAPLWNRTVSQNSLVDMKNAKGAGYSGKTVADDWYVKSMMLLKHARKSSQEVFAGCTAYSTQALAAVAEEGTERVVVPNAAADSLLVGSCMMLGTNSGGSTDRNYSYNFDVFDARRIARIEPYDSASKAVYFEGGPFDVAAGYLLSTAPWHSGSCDMVQGLDGSPTSPKSGKEPFVLQGIECMVGAYEVLSDIVMVAEALPDGTLREQAYRVYDSAKQAKALTADYSDTGYSLPIAPAIGWSYARDLENAGGLLAPAGTGATSTTGVGDAVYQNVAESKGAREWLGVGRLGGAAAAGLSCVGGNSGPGASFWHIAGRVSALGRSAP